MEHSELSEICRFLSKTPETVRLMIESLSVEKQRLKPSDNGFSILENICHLRDIEELGYWNRIRKILTEDNPFLPDINGDQLAIKRGYQSQNLTDELRRFSECRAESLSLIDKMRPEDLEKMAVMENVGSIKLGELLLMMSGHDREHLASIDELCSETGNPARPESKSASC